MNTVNVSSLIKFIVLAGTLVFCQSLLAQHRLNELPVQLETSISFTTSTFSQGKQVTVNIAVHNPTQSVVIFNRRGTIVDAIPTADAFDVSLGGIARSHYEIHARRLEASELDLVHIAPGENLVKQANLGYYYDFSEPGTYEVSLKGADSVSKIVVLEREILFKKTFGYRNCSLAQANSLEKAYNEAEVLARKAVSDLRNAPVAARPSAPRYREWFGSYNASRYGSVLTDFEGIDEALASEQMLSDCSCSAIAPSDRANVIAYVFPGQPFVINLCDLFFDLNLRGVDSQAGTIIHELSHFSVLSGTEDEVYGQSASRSLARSNPNLAIKNADNFAYFAVNSPRLRMSSEDLGQCRVTRTDRVSSIRQPQLQSFTSNALSQAVDDLENDYRSVAPAFYRQTSISRVGGDAAQSGAIGNNGISAMAVPVVGPGQVSFDWKVSSEDGFDALAFVIADSSNRIRSPENAFIDGEVNWRRVTYNIPSGNHTLLWAYVKDGSVSRGLDAGWVDNIDINVPPPQTFVSSGNPDTEVVCGEAIISPIVNFLLDDSPPAPAPSTPPAPVSGSCAGLSQINLGQTQQGSWSVTDQRSTSRTNSYADYYELVVSSTTNVTISLTSSVDTYLYLRSNCGTSGSLIEADDDGGSGLNSQIVRTLAPGIYTIEATTFSSNITGSYSLSVRSNP